MPEAAEAGCAAGRTTEIGKSLRLTALHSPKTHLKTNKSQEGCKPAAALTLGPHRTWASWQIRTWDGALGSTALALDPPEETETAAARLSEAQTGRVSAFYVFPLLHQIPH